MKILGHSLWENTVFFAWFIAGCVFLFMPDPQVTMNQLTGLMLISFSFMITRTEKS